MIVKTKRPFLFLKGITSLIGGLCVLGVLSLNEADASFYEENKIFFEAMQPPEDREEDSVTDFELRIVKRMSESLVLEEILTDEVEADVVLFNSYKKLEEITPGFAWGFGPREELRSNLDRYYNQEKRFLTLEESLMQKIHRAGRWSNKNSGDSEGIDLLTDWEQLDVQLFGNMRKPIEPSFWSWEEETLQFSNVVIPYETENSWHIGDPRLSTGYENPETDEEAVRNDFGADDPSFFADMERISEALRLVAESSIHGERIPLRLGDSSFYNDVSLQEKPTIGINVSLGHPTLPQNVKGRVYRDSVRKSLVSSFETMDTLIMESNCNWLNEANTAADLNRRDESLQICENWQAQYRAQENLLDSLILLYAEYDSNHRMALLLEHFNARWAPFGAQYSPDGSSKLSDNRISFWEKVDLILTDITINPL